MKTPQPPTKCSGGIVKRAWGDGGLDNSAAPNEGNATDRGGVVSKKNPCAGHGGSVANRDTHTGNRGTKAT